MNAHAQFLPNLEDDFFALLVRKNQGDKEEREKERERERERERFFLITPFISKLPLVSEKAITCLHICRMYELTYAINYLNN